MASKRLCRDRLWKASAKLERLAGNSHFAYFPGFLFLSLSPQSNPTIISCLLYSGLSIWYGNTENCTNVIDICLPFFWSYRNIKLVIDIRCMVSVVCFPAIILFFSSMNNYYYQCDSDCVLLVSYDFSLKKMTCIYNTIMVHS